MMPDGMPANNYRAGDNGPAGRDYHGIGEGELSHLKGVVENFNIAVGEKLWEILSVEEEYLHSYSHFEALESKYKNLTERVRKMNAHDLLTAVIEEIHKRG